MTAGKYRDQEGQIELSQAYAAGDPVSGSPGR
jgi:hypothetical protein